MNKTVVGIIIACIAVLVLGYLFVNNAGKTTQDIQTATEPTEAPPTQALCDKNAKIEVPSDLKITDTQEGTGQTVKNCDTVVMKYTGKLQDGTVFDSTDQHGGQPFTTQIGAGQVIKGWDLGIPGMKVGGKRELVIPSNLGYDGQAVGNIPPNSTLIFDVELVAIK